MTPVCFIMTVLPFMVEVTIWVDDDDEYLASKDLPPKMLQVRVFLPQQ